MWVPGLKLTAPKVGSESELPPRLVLAVHRAAKLIFPACDPAPPPPQASREAAYTVRRLRSGSVPRYNTEIQAPGNKDYSSQSEDIIII